MLSVNKWGLVLSIYTKKNMLFFFNSVEPLAYKNVWVILFANFQCSFLRDLELAYQVHGLLNTGDNRKLIGQDVQRKLY